MKIKRLAISIISAILLVSLVIIFTNIDKSVVPSEPDVVVEPTEDVTVEPEVLGGTKVSATCSNTDISSAITAASNGDTVVVPAGDCTWTADITVASSKKITLQGAGIGKTNITLNANVQLILTASGIVVNITGFSFTASGKATGDPWITLKGNQGWRIYRNSFANTNSVNNIAILINYGTALPHATGVIDHNTFTNARIYHQGDTRIGTTPGTGISGSDEWARATNWGEDRRVFIEDNTMVYSFAQGNCFDQQYGARTTIRFNTITGCPLEIHGATNGRSTRSVEAYYNDWVGTGNNPNAPGALFARGGTNIIFGNKFVTGYGATSIVIDDERGGTNNSSNGVIWTTCDGTNDLDHNFGIDASAGYPCRDQMGRGVDAFEFDPAVPPFATQATETVPFFLNRTAGVQTTITRSNGSADFLDDCVDFQNEDSTFDGTCGTGVGNTLAEAPATCTSGFTPVYYWATKEGQWNSGTNPIYGGQGRLYKCTATNTWTLYYTPYMYPHPLTHVANAAVQGGTMEIKGATIHLKSSYLPPFMKPEPLSLTT